MLGTPKTITTVLTANQILPIQESGVGIHVVSCTVPYINIGLDSDSPQRFYTGCNLNPPKGFRFFVLQDTGPGCTVVLRVSQYPADEQGSAILNGMAASLVSIDHEISGGGAPVQLADLLLPASPAAGGLVFAAAAARAEIEVTSPRKNAGTIYLGIAAARCSLIDNFFAMAPGGSWTSQREKRAIYASGSDAFQIINGKEI